MCATKKNKKTAAHVSTPKGSPAPAFEQVSRQALGTIVRHSLLAGFCPLIPLPFIDDYVIGKLHERMSRELFEDHGMTLSHTGAKILRDTPSSLLRSALMSMMLFPIKKLLKKIVFVLAIKGCVDVAAAIFHDGWMLARALEGAHEVDREALARNDHDELRRLRMAILATHDQVDTRPLQNIFRGIFRGGISQIDEAVSTLTSYFRSKRDPDSVDVSEAVREGGLGGMVEEIEGAVATEDHSYWEKLDALLATNLANAHNRSGDSTR